MDIVELVYKWSPTAGTALLFAGAAIWAYRKYSKWTHRIEIAEKDCKKIDGEIMPELRKISTSLNSLIYFLNGRDSEINPSLFISNSPLKLTQLGERLLVEIGGKTYIDKNLDELLLLMDEQGVKTALDSQNVAPIVISKVAANENFKPIKDYIFSNPIYKSKSTIDNQEITISMDIRTVCDIMGIYLRDKYLERHPELNPEDIPSLKSH